MVFFATFGNMLTNVATLMTRSYTPFIDSFGCQLQGFLIQVFMQGDAYWALAMAINVYLTFYYKFDARALRKMEIPYFLCCYGIPFIPGFTFLFVSNDAGRPYGNAVLWCWLRPEWGVYRIATFYGPVWVAIFIAMAIYIRAGREIYKKRKKMLNFSNSGTANGTVTGQEPFSPATDVFAPGYRTTEVIQTTEIVLKTTPSTSGIQSESGGGGRGGSSGGPNVSYSVTISAEAPPNDNDSVDGLDLETETTAGSDKGAADLQVTPTVQIPPSPAAKFQARRRFQRNMETHRATWSYTKCAILFFAALLVTWIPSSGNRVYSMIHNDEVSKPLFYASAFVLPLQGFWNAIIYAVTSWAACKTFWANIVSAVWTRTRSPIVEITNARNHHRDSRATWRKTEETTSMEDLTGSSRTLRPDRVSPV